MNYNYTQPQFQMPNQTGYSGYRPAPQYPQWASTASSLGQVRPVSSIEEVRACPIDFDGSVFYFADVANKRIYTKQINIDGTASINLYELKELPNPVLTDQLTNSSYVTKDEFEAAVIKLKNMYESLLVTKTEEKPKVEDGQQTAAQPTAQFSF